MKRGFDPRGGDPAAARTVTSPAAANLARALRGDRLVPGRGPHYAVVHAQPLAPVAAHVLDQRHERLALRRKRVLDPWGHLGEGVALDDALLLERPQAKRQGARADAGQRALQLAEAAAALGQVPDHEDRPLAADDVRSGADGTRGVRHASQSNSR